MNCGLSSKICREFSGFSLHRIWQYLLKLAAFGFRTGLGSVIRWNKLAVVGETHCLVALRLFVGVVAQAKPHLFQFHLALDSFFAALQGWQRVLIDPERVGYQ